MAARLMCPKLTPADLRRDLAPAMSPSRCGHALLSTGAVGHPHALEHWLWWLLPGQAKREKDGCRKQAISLLRAHLEICTHACSMISMQLVKYAWYKQCFTVCMLP